MDKKKKIRVVVVIPVVVTLIVLGMVVTFVLIAGAGKPAAGTMQPHDGAHAAADHDAPPGPPCTFDFLVGLDSETAVQQIAPLGRAYRVLGPNSMATQDFSPERINLMVDDSGVVQSVNCQ